MGSSQVQYMIDLLQWTVSHSVSQEQKLNLNTAHLFKLQNLGELLDVGLTKHVGIKYHIPWLLAREFIL